MYHNQDTPNKHGDQVCILWHFQADQWRTINITKVIFLNSCDLFLVTEMLDSSKIVQENFNFVVQEILERT